MFSNLDPIKTKSGPRGPLHINNCDDQTKKPHKGAWVRCGQNASCLPSSNQQNKGSKARQNHVLHAHH